MLTGFIVLVIIILILGALDGGESFGDTFRKGCGCLILLLVIGIIVLLIVFK